MKLNNRLKFTKSIISIDLETTGLSQDKDKIIEIGAIKFDENANKVSEFETYINPEIGINSFVQNLTGISNENVTNAPLFLDISQDLELFLSDSILIGHNVGFDKGFLNSNGMDLSNIFIDTWRFAQIILPELHDLSLGSICKYIGVEQLNAHRAKSDAHNTMEVFVYLLNRFYNLDPRLKSTVKNLILDKDNELYFLFNSLISDYQYTDEPFSLKELTVNSNDEFQSTSSFKLTDALIDDVFNEKSEILNSILDNFSYRPQQHEMSNLILKSLNENSKIAVEAGTGVGKSLAYLLPAAIYSLNTSKKVVISTNTINLQEQLYSKDLPIINKILENEEHFIKFCTLKGRDNYLCINTLSNQLIEQTDDIEYSRFLAKILVWISTTIYGDKSELGLSSYVDRNYWVRLTHKNTNCFGKNNGCFLYESKIRAENSNIIIVNHALLMSDLKSANNLIPKHEILMIDEAHNLEDVASNHLGWKVDEREIRDLSRLDLGKMNIIDIVEKIISKEFSSKEERIEFESDYELHKNRLRSLSKESELKLKDFLNLLNGIINSNAVRNAGIKTLRIFDEEDFGNKSKISTEWNGYKLHSDNLSLEISKFYKFIKNVIKKNKSLIENLNDIIFDWNENYTLIKSQLDDMFVNRNGENVFWIENNERFNNNEFFSAPVDVSRILNEYLFDNLDSMILTSATLNSNDDFSHLKNTLGLNFDAAKVFGSPFDYDNSVEIIIPHSVPEPNSENYLNEMNKIIYDYVVDMGGKSMALFTSHKSLRNSNKVLKEKLAEHNINVLAQGVDGAPHQIIKRFKKNSNSLILGTSSFWEGVDIDDGSLNLLIITKLPFDVPTHPLFSARSEKYQTPFFEYSIPRAVIKFKQGFGRLIRSEDDTGKVLLLDSRIVTKKYGKIFVESLPGGKIDYKQDYDFIN